MRLRRLGILALLAALTAPPAGAGNAPDETPAEVALEQLARTAGGRIDLSIEPSTGTFSFVRADEGRVLAVDDASQDPETRARRFLAEAGAVVGMSEGERARLGGDRGRPGSDLELKRIASDAAGNSHVRLEQRYAGVPVLGGEVVVHLSARGVTAVNGVFVPGLTLDPTPRLTPADARALGAKIVAAVEDAPAARAESAELTVFHTGLIEGVPGQARLAYEVIVADTRGWRRHLRAGVDRARIEADPRTPRRTVRRYLAGVGPEVVGGILGGDPGLHRGAVAAQLILPDAQIAWRDVWLGAFVTSILFSLGKTAIGIYLGNSGVASTFRAAGSLVLLLIWIYYSAQILFFGAEFTQVYANKYGSKIVPEDAKKTPEGKTGATGDVRQRPALPTPATGSQRDNRIERENRQTARVLASLVAASFLTGIVTTILGFRRR